MGDQSGELHFITSVPHSGIYTLKLIYKSGEEVGCGKWVQIGIKNSSVDKILIDNFIEDEIEIFLEEGENIIRVMNHRRQENTLCSYATMLDALNKANPNHDIILSNSLTRQIGLALEKKYAVMALNSGITTVRTVGGIGNLDSVLRDKINAGKILGPRLLVANSAIGVVGGHMDGTVAIAAKDEKDIVKLVKDTAKDKVDLIKLMITEYRILQIHYLT